MGGVGKTTLARHIFNHDEVKENFDLTSWVYVSENFNLKRILSGQMLSHPCGVHDSLDKILTEVREILQGKKFLIVLDDVWNEDPSKWEILRTALVVGSRGSMILVTTRSHLVASIMGTMEPIVLETLTEKVFWSLFRYYALHEHNIGGDQLKILDGIGKKIASKLHGLPLSAKDIGSMLRLNLNEKFWSYISMSQWWKLDPSVDHIMPSLHLSYEHLDSNLKPCFALCSVFPRGYIFKKRKIVQMWISQGFVASDDYGSLSLEEKGGIWLDDLTRRSFFQLAWVDKYIMHDLMRDLAIIISKDECFVMADESPKLSGGTIRHLCIQAADFEELTC